MDHTELQRRADALALKARLQGKDTRDRSDPEQLRREPYPTRPREPREPRSDDRGSSQDGDTDSATGFGGSSSEGTLTRAGTTEADCTPPATSPSRRERTPRALKRALRNYADHPVEWIAPGESVAQVLAQLGPETRSVYLVGPRPGGTLAGLRKWATGALPEGWEHAPGGHWLKGAAPVMRYRDYYQRSVEVGMASSWFGPHARTVDECARSWDELGQLLAGSTFTDSRETARLLATPATTGRGLLLRSIQFDREWPTLPADMQDLIRSTSGQGRMEVYDGPDELPALFRTDGRFMYAPLCRGLGSGPVQHDNGGGYDPQRRGRYRVEFRVPDDWRHVGILPVRGPDGWVWPSVPGSRHESWCDGAELLVAHKHGWDFTIRERLLLNYDGTGPLDVWSDRLRKLRAATDDEAMRWALRAILLHGLGSMHGRGHAVMHATEDVAQVPGETPADLRRQGDAFVWTEDRGQAWAEMCHPEWTSAVWGKARARLLDAPGARKSGRVGLLHVHPSVLVGCRTDAIYSTVPLAWADDGTDGRFRPAGEWGPMPRPRSQTALIGATGGD